MCYPVCVMVHIKDPLLLIEKSNPSSGDSRFLLSLFEWSLYENVLSALLNKTFSSFLPHTFINS